MKLKRNEKAADVKGFKGIYAITTNGRVWSYRRNKWLTPFDVGQGYCTVRLCVQGNESDKKVHRLVAGAFIPNPDNKPQVNHINGKKWDNRLSNLEWCTARENQQHASATGLSGRNKLTYEQRVLICQMHHISAAKKMMLATIFGVTLPAICYIIKTYSPILGFA